MHMCQDSDYGHVGVIRKIGFENQSVYVQITSPDKKVLPPMCL